MMHYFIELANPLWLLGMLPLLITAAIVVAKVKKCIQYRYPLSSFLSAKKGNSGARYIQFFYILRCALLFLLALTSARPQLVDSQSPITVEGLDIMLALDFSGSMISQDTVGDPRSRIDVAKEEVKRFVQARTDDAIGLVVFGGDAVTRCPITHDKKMLITIIDETFVGDIVDPRETHLATALIAAANRLKQSRAKSKIIILLTDGHPSEGDMSAQMAIEVARALHIKIYTIGVGYDEPRTITHPLYGTVTVPETIDGALLRKIATDTNGAFFLAHNAQDMKKIYATIDELEKSHSTKPIFSHKYELGFVGIVFAIIIVCCEILISTYVWFGL